jgi:CO dehydrogenase/acetyl-CoA synthase gamma subunit (corrinoid Fe-S protein)
MTENWCARLRHPQQRDAGRNEQFETPTLVNPGDSAKVSGAIEDRHGGQWHQVISAWQ